MPCHRDQLDGLLAQHRLFLVQAQACVDKDFAESENDQLRAFISRLSKKIGTHLQWLDSTDEDAHNGEEAVCWGPITTARKTTRKGAQVQLTVTGPSPEDSLTIKTNKKTDDIDKMEAQLQRYDALSKALARAVEQQQSVFALHNDGSLAHAGHGDPAEDQARIILLRRYNDVRDVAQQLIGIIAEHRQVPVRSLYRDGSYGVGADD